MTAQLDEHDRLGCETHFSRLNPNSLVGCARWYFSGVKRSTEAPLNVLWFSRTCPSIFPAKPPWVFRRPLVSGPTWVTRSFDSVKALPALLRPNCSRSLPRSRRSTASTLQWPGGSRRDATRTRRGAKSWTDLGGWQMHSESAPSVIRSWTGGGGGRGTFFFPARRVDHWISLASGFRSWSDCPRHQVTKKNPQVDLCGRYLWLPVRTRQLVLLQHTSLSASTGAWFTGGPSVCS